MPTKAGTMRNIRGRGRCVARRVRTKTGHMTTVWKKAPKAGRKAKKTTRRRRR